VGALLSFLIKEIAKGYLAKRGLTAAGKSLTRHNDKAELAREAKLYRISCQEYYKAWYNNQKK
jgi:hypothetical protein